MSSANDMQVGGDHYKGEYQHWDWAVDIRLGYLESAATKYIARWRKKAGVQDLEKARHYVQKAYESAKEKRYENWSLRVSVDRFARFTSERFTDRYIESANLDNYQSLLSRDLADWRTPTDLEHTLELLDKYIAVAKEAVQGPGTRAGATTRATPSRGPVATCGAAAGVLHGPGSTSAPSGVARKQSDGMEHPFGYNLGDEV